MPQTFCKICAKNGRPDIPITFIPNGLKADGVTKAWIIKNSDGKTDHKHYEGSQSTQTSLGDDRPEVVAHRAVQQQQAQQSQQLDNRLLEQVTRLTDLAQKTNGILDVIAQQLQAISETVFELLRLQQREYEPDITTANNELSKRGSYELGKDIITTGSGEY